MVSKRIEGPAQTFSESSSALYPPLHVCNAQFGDESKQSSSEKNPAHACMVARPWSIRP
jgi:hypothetical protein